MKKTINYILAAFFISSLASQVSSTSQSTGNAISDAWIKVYQSDNSKQCQENSGIPLEVMLKKLNQQGIKVKCSQKNNNGMMHIQMCGGATGIINVFEINREDLKTAQKLGFNSVGTLDSYHDIVCK
ncbi:MAG: hypothetical protein V4525_15615 [Pseudomonadota bacterium]